jgi:hypothetical protein
MKKNQKRRGFSMDTPFGEEEFASRPKKAIRVSKPKKRLRPQDLDLDDEI